MLALCELGLGEDTITEAWHHPGKLVPPVYTACDVTQPDCAVMAECRLSVTFLTPSYVLAMVFPLPHFCSLFQPCINCPQNHVLLFPMSTLYMRELILVGWVSQGSWASWRPSQSSQWEVAVGDRSWEERQSWGISSLLFLPWATSPPLTSAPTREAHRGSSFCIPTSSNITASPCSSACR